MAKRRVEGGPMDGEWFDSDAHIIRVPRRVPFNADMGLTYSVWEYERVGSVYRFETLIGDAVAEMAIAGQVFREPEARRYARLMLRRNLERLAPTKEVDRIVWVVALDRSTLMFTLVAVVGGRRSDHAAHIREERRAGLPSAR